jgi:hypothetical protein
VTLKSTGHQSSQPCAIFPFLCAIVWILSIPSKAYVLKAYVVLLGDVESLGGGA